METQVQTKSEENNAQYTIAEVATWDDEKCRQMANQTKFTLVNIRDFAKSYLNLEQKWLTLRTVLFKGLLRGYTIKCPHCQEVYNVNVSDFNRDSEVVCPACGQAHKQDDNVLNIVINDDVEMVKPKKKRASKKSPTKKSTVKEV